MLNLRVTTFIVGCFIANAVFGNESLLSGSVPFFQCTPQARAAVHTENSGSCGYAGMTVYAVNTCESRSMSITYSVRLQSATQDVTRQYTQPIAAGGRYSFGCSRPAPLQEATFSIVGAEWLGTNPNPGHGGNVPTEPLPPPDSNNIVIRAAGFFSAVGLQLQGDPNNGYGVGVLLNSSPYDVKLNEASWVFNAKAGTYRFFIEYASAEARTTQVFINGLGVKDDATNRPTAGACYQERCQELVFQGPMRLLEGQNVITIRRNNFFPHVRSLKFEKM